MYLVRSQRLAVFLALTLAVLSPGAASAFDPHHIERLKSTKFCEKCDLVGAMLEKADLSGARLAGANLAGAVLSAANLRVDVSGFKRGESEPKPGKTAPCAPR